MTPDSDWEHEVAFSNEYAPRLLAGYPRDQVQKCIMIDDLHSKRPVDKKFFEHVVSKLEVKPDCVYLESSFLLMAADIVKQIDPKVGALTDEEERQWLRDVRDKYNSTNDFLISWRKKDGAIMFSCPTLVATSYVYRLGLLSATVQPFWGEPIQKATTLVNLLSSKYLQVEANAQTIIKGVNPRALECIRWSFY